MVEKRNYYEILELATDASLQEIHNAYQRAKNAYSGDSVALYSLMTQNECDAILDQIEQAYSILGVPEKRREYDKVRGFNQKHTPEGFNEDINSRLNYKPKGSLTDLLNETNLQVDAPPQKNREEFQYNQAHSPRNEVTISKISAFKKFGLNFHQNDEMEQAIENCTEYTGSFLRRIREYKNVTIERMADMTKISKTYIRNIENDDHIKLPAEVYTRGFVYQYAKVLKLNPELVATSYIHQLKQRRTQDHDVK